jgi:hypothetical protein
VENMDYWRLCDEVSVIQAILLLIGEDPSDTQYYVENWEPSNRPTGYNAAKAAITHAVLSGRLPATIRKLSWERAHDEKPDADEETGTDDLGRPIIYKKDPNWTLTTVEVEDLKSWLRSRGFRTGFFFPNEIARPVYLNREDACFSSKLAAAISAWEAVRSDPVSTRGKSVKQALLTWLRKNADRFGLSKDDGSPNEQGIEEVAKIANWDTRGGAPKTPGDNPPTR